METLVARGSNDAPSAIGREGVLLRSLRIYGSHFSVFVWTFLLPAAAHCVWIVLQRTMNYVRRPTWPQEGIIFGANGNSVYPFTLELTWIGALVFLAFAGPAVAAATTAAASLHAIDSAQSPSTSLQITVFRSLNAQLVATFRAWWIFAGALIAAMIVSFTMLASGNPIGFDLWRLLLGVAFIVGIPFGIWMTVRYALAVPVTLYESRGIGAALKRSVQLTKGIRLRMFAVFGLAAGLRWALGFAANTTLGAFARAHRATAFTEALVLIPLLAFVFDLLIGSIAGIVIAIFYGRQTKGVLLDG